MATIRNALENQKENSVNFSFNKISVLLKHQPVPKSSPTILSDDRHMKKMSTEGIVSISSFPIVWYSSLQASFLFLTIDNTELFSQKPSMTFVVQTRANLLKICHWNEIKMFPYHQYIQDNKETTHKWHCLSVFPFCYVLFCMFVLSFSEIVVHFQH